MSHAHTLVSMIGILLLAGTASAQTAPPPAGYPQQPPPPVYTQQPPPAYPQQPPPPGYGPQNPPPPGYGPQNPPPVYLPTADQRSASGWQDGDPVPYGYHVAERRSGGLIGGGLGMFLPTYSLSLLCAALGNSGGNGDQWWPLAIPGVGPLIGIGTIKNTDMTGGTVLVVDAGLQIGGLVMLFMGIQGHKFLVRNDFGLEVQPLMNAGVTHTGNGVQLNFTF